MYSDNKTGGIQVEEQNTFDYRECIFTIVFLAMNVISYIYCTYVGETVYNIGCMDAERVISDHEYYRFLTSIFMHGGVEHLVSNMIFLAALGEMLERSVGHVRFIFLYLISGFGGSIFSIASAILSGSRYTSVGASGAIFGLIGALLVLVVISRGHYQGISIKRMVLATACMIYEGAVSEGVDNAAHLGGLIFGLLIMSAMNLVKAYKK